ncbi:MAG: tetratricopeptide repeat protein [Emcibacter sp.]|nr:tetratricopeptide repeat protein [Emcibacter sp.]
MKYNIITIFLILTGGSFSASAQTFPLMENSWQDPAFVKRFMGSYGIHSEIEPRVSMDERDQLSSIVSLVDKDIDGAIQKLSKIARPESSAVFDFLLGQMYLQTGKYQKAVFEYEIAIRKFPEFLRAYKNIGIAHIQLNQCGKARPHILKVMEMGGADGLSYGFLGHCYLQDEKYAAALKAYKMASLFQPDYHDWKSGEAQASLLAEKYNDAIILLDELIMDNPGEAKYWMMQANAYMALEDNVRATANLEVVKRMDKATAQSLLLLGNLYMADGMSKLAYPAFSAALEKKERPDFKKARKAFDYLAADKNWPAATRFLADIKKAYPEKNFQIMEAYLEIGKGNVKRAARILKAIVARDPMNGKVLMLLAHNYREQNDFERAEFMYERAARLDGFTYEALRMNARMAVGQNRLRHGLGLLQAAAKIKSDDILQQNIRILKNALKAKL